MNNRDGYWGGLQDTVSTGQGLFVEGLAPGRCRGLFSHAVHLVEVWPGSKDYFPFDSIDLGRQSAAPFHGDKTGNSTYKDCRLKDQISPTSRY